MSSRRSNLACQWVVWCENASTANEVNIFFGLLQSFCLLFAQLLGSKQTSRLSTVAASDDIADVGCCHRHLLCLHVSSCRQSLSVWLLLQRRTIVLGRALTPRLRETMLLLACTIMFGSDRTSPLNSSGRSFYLFFFLVPAESYARG